MCLSLCGVVVAISEIKNYETIVHVPYNVAPCDLFFLDRTMRFLDRLRTSCFFRSYYEVFRSQGSDVTSDVTEDMCDM